MSVSSSRWVSRAAGALFTGWFLASAYSQDPFRKLNQIRQRDRHRLFIPDWRFFGPRPGVDDYHVMFRDRGADDRWGPWREIEVVTPRRPVHILWHPHRKYEKVLFDATSELIMLASHYKDVDRLPGSIPYQVLLDYALHEATHEPDATTTQFLVAASDGYQNSDPPLLLYVSGEHSLTEAVNAPTTFRRSQPSAVSP